MRERRPNYRIVEDGRTCLCIEDVGPWDMHPTVTNAVEVIVAELAQRLHGRRLEYIDSEGDRSEIVTRRGAFVRFKVVGEVDEP